MSDALSRTVSEKRRAARGRTLARRRRLPKSEVDCVVRVVTGDRVVVGARHDDLAAKPNGALLSVRPNFLSGRSIKPNRVHNVLALNLPGIPEREPDVGDLYLRAILDELLENAVRV